jgi:hypothetical protein
MTAFRGNRTPLSISDTTVFESGVSSCLVRASSVRSEGLSALRCTVCKSAASSPWVVTDARSRSSVYSASSTSGVPVRKCPLLSPSVRPSTRRGRGRPALVSDCHRSAQMRLPFYRTPKPARLSINHREGAQHFIEPLARNHSQSSAAPQNAIIQKKDLLMIIAIYIVLLPVCSFILFIFGFAVGRCARKIPILDNNLPQALHRGQIPFEDPEVTRSNHQGNRGL